MFPKKRLVSWSHPADVLWVLKEPESLHSAPHVIIFLSAESQKVSKRTLLFSRPVESPWFFLVWNKKKKTVKWDQLFLVKNWLWNINTENLETKEAFLKGFWLNLYPHCTLLLCPCLLWFLSLFSKTSVVWWKNYEVKTFICVVVHSKCVTAEWKPEMKGLINNIFYSYSSKKRLHLFIPWSSFSFQLPFLKGRLMLSLGSSRSPVKKKRTQNTFNFG